MNCNWSPLVLARVSLAALVTALFLLACGGESAPPAPPAPPPFQPQSVVVQLGTKGGATTLISTQAGGWTRNGQPFTSGSTIRGENAQSYTLTLVNGTWTAQFVEPDPVPLALGSSGDAVSLQLQEDGSFKLGDETLTSGTVVKAKNENKYKLTLGSDGAWMADFEPPDPQRVTLGTSGQMLQINQLEDGSFTLNGDPLATGKVVPAQNGNSYTLTLGADDTWSATYLQPAPQPLQLGSTGDVLLVYRQENGTYLLDGEQLLGGRVVTASNGQRYRLSLRTGQDGMVSWVANYQTSTVSVTLGASGGRVSLTRKEDGTWLRGTNKFSSGDTVTGVNGFEYRLTLGADGNWIVESLPATINVTVIGADTTLQLARHEDGSFRYDNRIVASGDEIEAGDNTYRLRYANRRWTATFLQGNVTVPLGAGSDTITLIKKADGTYELNGTRVRNASVVRSPSTGIRYRLSLSNGVWSSSVYIPPTTDPGDGGGGTAPVVAEDILDALPSHLIENGAFKASLDAADRIKADAGNTNADGDEIDYSRYDGSGRYEDDTFVESAIRAINKILGPIEKDNLADGTDAQKYVAGVVINANWAEVKKEVELIFEAGRKITLSTNPPTDVDEAIDDLEDLREDLSDIAKFKSTYKSEIGAAITADNDVTGDKIFNARKQVLALGSSTNTRFGVRAGLSGNPTAENIAGETDLSDIYTRTPFSYSPLAATPTADLPGRGTARYTGRTWAIAQDLKLYSGSIELLASLGIQKITSKVTGLRRSDNNATWVREGREVRTIELPEVNYGRFQTGGLFSHSGNTKVVYEESGGAFDDPVNTELKGQFVGSDQSAGTAVIGTWKVGSELTGSFGAERGDTNRVNLPATESIINTTLKDPASPDSDLTFDTTNKTVGIDGFDRTYSLTSLSGWTNEPAANTTTNKNRATISLGSTSLTRFGAWKLVDHTDSASLNTLRDGVFAYSQLAGTAYAQTDNNYPRRVRAVYRGGTVAIDSSDRLYSGSYRLTVQWSSSEVGGRMTAVISGSSLFSLGGNRVSQIEFTGTFSGVSDSIGHDSTGATVQYANGSEEAMKGYHTYRFLGESVDGPFAVIGDWYAEKDSSNRADGSYGANLVPAP